jgi:hypothetical protein
MHQLFQYYNTAAKIDSKIKRQIQTNSNGNEVYAKDCKIYIYIYKYIHIYIYIYTYKYGGITKQMKKY